MVPTPRHVPSDLSMLGDLGHGFPPQQKSTKVCVKSVGPPGICNKWAGGNSIVSLRPFFLSPAVQNRDHRDFGPSGSSKLALSVICQHGAAGHGHSLAVASLGGLPVPGFSLPPPLPSLAWMAWLLEPGFEKQGCLVP